MPVFSKPINTLLLLLSALGIVNAAAIPPINTRDSSTTAVQGPDPRDIPEGIHYWPIDEDEKDRLSKLLNVDFRSLNILGTFVKAPKATCEGCGKRSGLEDFIDNALKANIHSREWMVDVLRNGKPNSSPAHQLECASCGERFKRDDLVAADTRNHVAKRQETADDPGFQWPANFNWIYGAPRAAGGDTTGREVTAEDGDEVGLNH